MDNVSNQHQCAQAVIIDQRDQTQQGVVRRRERQNLAAVAVSPRIAEMKVGHREQIFLYQISCAPRVEHDPGSDFEPRVIHGVASSIALHHWWNSLSCTSNGSSTSSASRIFVAYIANA